MRHTLSWLGVVLLACSGAPHPTPEPPSCTPAACGAASCGDAPDGCGGVVHCGACGAGQTCGGGGTANVCGVGTCTPSTCAGQGKNCGDISDGCGRILACGSCAEGQTCGGGGTANVCGGGSCTPTTCAALGMSCGDAPDGCGGTLHCGTCLSPGATRWIRADATLPALTAVAAGGGRIVGVTAGGDAALAAFDLEGRTLWTRPDPLVSGGVRQDGFSGVAIAPVSAELFAWSQETPSVFRFAPDGTSPTLVPRPPDMGIVFFLAVDRLGGVLQAGGAGSTNPDVYTSDSGSWRLDSVGIPDSDDPYLFFGGPVAFDAQDRALVTGHVRGTVTYQGVTVGRPRGVSSVVFQLDHGGHVRWGQTVGDVFGDHQIHGVGTSAIGTVVLLVGSTLLTYEADGTPRWTRTSEIPDSGRLAVDPAGQAVVVGPQEDCGFVVTRYNLAGDFLWKREFMLASCQGSVTADGIAIVGHDAVISGTFRGTIDFGTGARTSAVAQPFLLDLAP